MKTKIYLTVSAVLLFMHFQTAAQVLEQDSLALVAFYNSTGGPDWTNHSGWLTGPVNTWYGVTVEGNRVVELTLYMNNLVGTIPQEIGILTGLKELKLGHDEGLGGEIPEEIGNLSLLEVFVVCNCSNLLNLALWENHLNGPIPHEIGNLYSLKFLELFNNHLTGFIPSELGNCTNLWELRLNNNQLTGELPRELSFLNQLYYLDVSNNFLEGEIPDDLANVTSYEDLFFNNNFLTGIPPWDNNWFLNALGIENNKMTFEDIEPHFVGYMWFNYSPQDSMELKIDTILKYGNDYNIYSGTGGVYTEYYWYKNGNLLLQSPEADTLSLKNISYSDTGIYYCRAINSLATELTLVRRPVHIGIDTTEGINEQSGKRKNLICYPNPADKQITVTLPVNDEMIMMSILNIYGRCIWMEGKKPDSNSQVTIDLEWIPEGIYLLQIKTTYSEYYKKIIKR